MFAALKTRSSCTHLMPSLFIVFCCLHYMLSNCGADAAVVPLDEAHPAHYKVSLGDLEQLLRAQRLPPAAAEAVLMPSRFDKMPAQTSFYAKIPYAGKREEKRREFEHGWEQCEFSPISCMLRRRKR